MEDLKRQLATLSVQVGAQGRTIDDLDDSLRRFKGRRAKQDERDSNPPEHPAPLNGARRPEQLPTIHSLRAAGRMPW